MNNDSNKKKILMKSAMAFTFALAMFGANGGGDVSAEEALSTGKVGINTEYDETGGEEDVQQGDSADNGDGTKGITTNYDETETEAASSVPLLGTASGYNVFVEGNYTQTGNVNIDAGDGGGVVGVGGNVNVGENCHHKGASFEVGGSVTGNLQGDKVSTGSDCSVDFGSAFDELRATSSALSQIDGVTVNNGSDTDSIKSEYGTITLKGSDANVNVFTITVDEFNAMKTSENMAIRYDVPDGSAVILNIVGEGDVNLVFDWGAYYNGGSLTSGNKYGNSKVMINVPDGNDVTIASGVGNLLAPSSSVTGGEDKGYNPHYEGQVICKDFTGNIQFGSSAFDYDIETSETPDVPEEKEEETPDTPVEEEKKDETPDTPEEKEDETPYTPEEKEDETPDTPDTPVEEEEETPDTPDPEPTPDTPDVPYNPYENIETFDEPEESEEPEAVFEENEPVFEENEPVFEEIETVSEDNEPVSEEAETASEDDVEDSTEDVNETFDDDEFETFDDVPVPLSDTPFDNDDVDSTSSNGNPKTGEDMTLPVGSAAAAMASFLALMYANKKKREENAG